jgi:hypothetical protein
MVLPEDDKYEYRFDKKTFAVKKGSDTALAHRLADTRTIELAGRSELKSLSLTHGADWPAGDHHTAARHDHRGLLPTPAPLLGPAQATRGRDHIALALHLIEVVRADRSLLLLVYCIQYTDQLRR